ncbi:CBS domain-containing protein [Nocardia miyunensis]|uniref:CBS domain-containing protein n=1 Tax=Nocardia miyunensis TaxID=282684 RepID=UPI001C3F687E|nr:CBS domain-containing protein [Nocardia miyunensis]
MAIRKQEDITLTTARELMSPHVACAHTGDSVVDAARKLAATHDGALPVCDANGTLMGMLTDRDIVLKVVAQQSDPLTVRVGDLVGVVPYVVQADADVTTALKAMAEHRVSRIPVLEGTKLVGILAEADLARALAHRIPAREAEIGSAP